MQEEKQTQQEFERKEAMYEGYLKDLQEGQVLKGKIVAITQKDILVDIGYKSEGIIPLEEFLDPSGLKVGEEIEVLLETKEDDEGRVILSKRKAERTIGWEKITTDYKEGDVIQGKVVKRVKGGFTVDVGVEAFLPLSQASLRGGETEGLMSAPVEFKIVKINKPRKNIVLSRRDVLMKAQDEAKGKFLGELKIGEIREGVIKNITDFGAFVSLGPIDGLLHITDMSWGRISHPTELISVGNKIEVMILNVDKDNNRVSLGLKQKTPSPWKDAESKYAVNSKVKGKVTNIVPYGAFIEVEKGIEGLVHISEISWTKRVANPGEILKVGDIVEAVVLSIDAENEKLSLGIKQTQPNPWLEVDKKYTVGSKVKGTVRNFQDYGAFVELEEGIDGLIHISDISWTKKINHPSEALKKGDAIEAIILEVDGENRKISLGIKQLTPDPWEELSKKYALDSAVEGTITKIAAFGIFIELQKDLEGLVHISEIELPEKTKLEEKFKLGDTVKAKVIKIDSEQRKIGLSTKGIN
ncbi:MAG: 30S ribosomal protein S1 [Candidatus Omnitrophota bacterium]